MLVFFILVIFKLNVFLCRLVNGSRMHVGALIIDHDWNQLQLRDNLSLSQLLVLMAHIPIRTTLRSQKSNGLRRQ